MQDNSDIQPATANNTENTNKTPPWLTPWKPGQSGNPKGRPKIDPDLKAILADKSKRALERIVELIESDDERIAFMASKELLDRALGKPRNAEEDDADDKRSLTINIVKYTDGNNAPQQVAPQTVSVRTLALS